MVWSLPKYLKPETIGVYVKMPLSQSENDAVASPARSPYGYIVVDDATAACVASGSPAANARIYK